MENLPEKSDPSTELSLDVQDDGVVVMGTAELIDSYIARLREVTSNEVSSSAISKSDLGTIAGVAAGAANATAQHGRYVKISKQSLDLARAGKLVPAGGGYFRATTVGVGNKFTGQMVWKPLVGSPARLASVQMIVIQMALTTALADVQKAVERVEDKVDDLLALSKAQMVGDIVGSHNYLKRLTAEVKRGNGLSNSDWEAVASLGPALEQGLERIRAYVTTTVGRLDPTLSLSARAELIEKAVNENRLGESLQLLLIAEQTFYYWQQLRLRRVVDTEPRHRESVHASVQEILKTQARLDAELWSKLHAQLNGFDKVKPLEIGQFWDVNTLKKHTPKLKVALEDFRTARAGQFQEWDTNKTPGISEAIDELGAKASYAVDRGQALAAEGLRGLAGLLDGSKGDRQKDAVELDTDSAMATKEHKSD